MFFPRSVWREIRTELNSESEQRLEGSVCMKTKAAKGSVSKTSTDFTVLVPNMPVTSKFTIFLEYFSNNQEKKFYSVFYHE